MDGKPQNKLVVKYQEVSPRNIEESPINAREMGQADFNRLVKNISKDKALTSAVLLMEQPGKNKYLCISGHHRIRAAIKANIELVPSLIIPEVDESTRTRLQISHNDIQGKDNIDILNLMIKNLDPLDVSFIDTSNLDLDIDASEIDIEIKENIIDFQYINICLIPSTKEAFQKLIAELSDEDNYLVDEKAFEISKELMTYAFKHGFRTPGQAYGKFIDIVKAHLNEVKRDKKNKE